MSKKIERREPRKRLTQPTDRIICKICGHEFVRWNRSKHNKIRIHQAMEKINNDIRMMVFEKKKKDIGFISVSEFKKMQATDRVKKKILDL